VGPKRGGTGGLGKVLAERLNLTAGLFETLVRGKVGRKRGKGDSEKTPLDLKKANQNSNRKGYLPVLKILEFREELKNLHAAGEGAESGGGGGDRTTPTATWVPGKEYSHRGQRVGKGGGNKREGRTEGV